MSFSFSKEERLCSRLLIEQLYAEGHRMMAFPYSVQWLVRPPDSELCQVLIVAPKRRFHHAVDRNRVKRLTRECWRHVKPQLYEALAAHGARMTLSLVYIHNEILPYDKLMAAQEKMVNQLIKELEK